MISSSSSKKVLFVSYVPQLYEPNRYSPRESQQRTSRTAIVVERSSADQVSIQGYAAVPYKDKHKCWSLFQRAVKELLAVPSSLSIYIRFADPPHSAISSLHTVLQVPSHVVNLTVSPLPSSVHTSPPSTATDTTTFLQAKDERDPYCRYRDLYQKPPRRSLTGCRSMDGQHGDASRSSSGFVRQKCDFAEMNRLLSQLAEVSLSLQRTKEECDMIAKRCPPKPKERTQIKKCNGSCMEEVDKAAPKEEVVRELESEEESAVDKKVEELIHMAHSITQGITTGPEQQQTAQVSPLPAHHSASNLPLPDCPSDVFVRPSFSTGSAYVMWNPVSIDVNDSNHGYKVFGYLVYVDEQLWAESPGPLSSQVELDGLKHNTEYHIQVCTHAEHNNSPLSSPFTYSHTEYRKSNSSTPCHLSVRQADSRVKAARVESWLKSSQTPLLSLDTRGHSPTDSNLLSPHVHFAKETCTQDLHSRTATDSSTLNGHKQYLLHTGSAGEQESPSTEDTKSITSSHTSGIVTDLPNSPKLSPACGCARCSNTESVDAGIETLNSCSHRHHHHQREFCHGGCCGSLSLLGSTAARSQPCKKTTQSSATSVTSSTLCPSPIPSTASYIPDTVIDEPLDLKLSNPDLKSNTSLATSVGLPSSMKPISGPFARYGLASPHKGPSSPQDVRVGKGQRGNIVITWTPVSRDLKGCSCGFYVLGYRVYVNGAFSQTVDGAMKFETSLKCPLSDVQPPYHRLLIHVRTRSIAAESLPSNTVIYDLMLQRVVEPSERKKPLDSVMSSVDTASLYTKTSASLVSHPVSRASTYPPTNNTHQHLETFV